LSGGRGRFVASRVGIVAGRRRLSAVEIGVRVGGLFERLHDAAAFGSLERIGPGQVADLRKIDGDAHPLLAPPDLAVLIVDESRVPGLGLSALVAFVGRQIVEALATVADPPLGLTHGYSIPMADERSTPRTDRDAFGPSD
jgi:hypothetical protein